METGLGASHATASASLWDTMMEAKMKMESEQEKELRQATGQTHKEEIVQRFHEADAVYKEAEKERSNLRAEILVDFEPGVHKVGNYIVEVKPQNRASRIDWEALYMEANGEGAVEAAREKHKLCADSKPVFTVSVKSISK